MATVLAVLLGGCAASKGPGGSSGDAPSPVELAKTSLGAGNLDGAETVIADALAVSSSRRKSGTAVRQGPDTPELLVLRTELRIRQKRFAEAEADALTAMALVPSTPSVDDLKPPPASPPAPAGSGDKNAPTTKTTYRTPLTQRSIHMRMAQLFEDAGRDDDAESHIKAARALCTADPALLEYRECEREREALVRVRVARGRYSEAEPLVLSEIADTQQRYGAYDLRLSIAFCHAAHFYARQGKYALSGPLYARSFDLWKTGHEEALAEHTRALSSGYPSPFDADFLRPRAGHLPLTAPCGLEDQPDLLYKLGKAEVAAQALRFEQRVWGADKEAGTMVVANLDALIARAAPALDLAMARNAVAFVAMKKLDRDRAEAELRQVTEAYAAAWPTLPLSERRYYAEDYLRALGSLVELLRSSQRFPEAVALGERAVQVAGEIFNAYDSLRLDTLLSMAKTYREMRDPERTETAAGRYLDAIVTARGDRSSDYAWALRTISFAYLLREELDASLRMEMQAKAIWAKQGTVAPEF